MFTWCRRGRKPAALSAAVKGNEHYPTTDRGLQSLTQKKEYIHSQVRKIQCIEYVPGHGKGTYKIQSLR